MILWRFFGFLGLCIHTKRRLEGGTQKRPPSRLWKSHVIFHRSISRSNFSKNTRNLLFSWMFVKQSLQFSKKFLKHLCFCLKGRKISAWFLKLFEEYAKIMTICNFVKKYFCKFSKIFRPLTPYDPSPLKFSLPRTKFLQAPLIDILFLKM